MRSWEVFTVTKIAVVSDDGQSVSAHFGRARFYVVVTGDSGRPVARETRSKAGHHSFDRESVPEAPAGAGQPHGFDPASREKHAKMAEAISDCQAVIAGGMGMGAFQSLEQSGLTVIITDIPLVDDAVQAYLDGTIRNLRERLH